MQLQQNSERNTHSLLCGAELTFRIKSELSRPGQVFFRFFFFFIRWAARCVRI